MDTLPQPACIHGCRGWEPVVRWDSVRPLDYVDGDRLQPVPQSVLVYEVRCEHTGVWAPLDHMDEERKAEALDLYYEPTLI